MAIPLNDNIELNAPKPIRSTDIVGIDWIYANKEAIPTAMRHPFMRTTDNDTGFEWWLVGGIADADWVRYGSLASLTKDKFLVGDANNQPKEVLGIEEWSTSMPTQKGIKQRTNAQINLAGDSAIIGSVINVAPININVTTTASLQFLPQQAKKFIIYEAYFVGINLNPNGNTDLPNIKLQTANAIVAELNIDAATMNNKITPMTITSPTALIDLNVAGNLTIDVASAAWVNGAAQIIIKGQVI